MFLTYANMSNLHKLQRNILIICSTHYVTQLHSLIHGLVGGRSFPTGLGPDGLLWFFFPSTQAVKICPSVCLDPGFAVLSLKSTDRVAWTLVWHWNANAVSRSHSKRRWIRVCALLIWGLSLSFGFNVKMGYRYWESLVIVAQKREVGTCIC